MKRAAIVVFIALAVSVSMFGTASAQVANVTVESKGDLSDSKTAVTVNGTITCTVGDTASVTVILAQSSGQVGATGTGFAEGIVCAGVPQQWSAVVIPVSGNQFKHGPATVVYGASDTSGDSTELHTERIGL